MSFNFELGPVAADIPTLSHTFLYNPARAFQGGISPFTAKFVLYLSLHLSFSCNKHPSMKVIRLQPSGRNVFDWVAVPRA